MRYAALQFRLTPESTTFEQRRQQRLQRLIGRRHGVGNKLGGLHPEKLLAFMRRDRSPPAPAEEERHQQVEVRIVVACEGERRKIGCRDIDAELLGELANEGMLGRFPKLDLASGEFPQPGKRSAFRPLGDQDPAVAVKQHAGRDQHEWKRAAFHGRVTTGSRH